MAARCLSGHSERVQRQESRGRVLQLQLQREERDSRPAHRPHHRHEGGAMRHTVMLRALCALSTLLALASACGPDMTLPFEVKEPRLLAARIEVEGDPTRP